MRHIRRNAVCYSNSCFNPRTREGCDGKIPKAFENYEVLIHAPVRGATQHLRMLTPASEVLIHAPVRGATAKSYKIGSDFSALFRKFIQKLGIVTFRISIF